MTHEPADAGKEVSLKQSEGEEHQAAELEAGEEVATPSPRMSRACSFSLPYVETMKAIRPDLQTCIVEYAPGSNSWMSQARRMRLSITSEQEDIQEEAPSSRTGTRSSKSSPV